MTLTTLVAAALLIVAGLVLRWHDRIRDRSLRWLLLVAAILLFPSVVAISEGFLGGGWSPADGVFPIVLFCGLAIEAAFFVAVLTGDRFARSLRDNAAARAEAKVGVLLIGACAVFLLVPAVILWLSAVLLAPHLDGPAPDRRTAEALVALQVRAESQIGDGHYRVVLLRADNVGVYLPRQTFERIPYPDRHAVLWHVGSSWCATASPLLLPSVYFFDIKSGEPLDSCLCLAGPR